MLGPITILAMTMILDTSLAHDYIGHNDDLGYILAVFTAGRAENVLGHNYICYKYIGHNYIYSAINISAMNILAITISTRP